LAKKLYVGGLSYDTTDEGLRAFFEQVGPVGTASIATDRYTGRARGFGFVEMFEDSDATKAIQELNGKVLDGRTLTVDEAKPPQRGGDRGRGGGGGGRGGGYGGGGGGRGGGYGGGYGRGRG
jgi:cold-inducible RNA-binding protein